MLRQINQSRLIFAAVLVIGLITLTANVSLAQQADIKAGDVVIKDVSVNFMIGVVAQPVSDTLRAQLPQLKEQGLEVRYIGTKTPAQQAGVQRHDILLTANKQVLKTILDLKRVVEQAGKDKKPIILGFLRGGKQQTIQVKVIKNQFMAVPINISEENRHLGSPGTTLKPVDSKKTMVITKDRQGDEVRITTTEDGKHIIVVGKYGQIVMEVAGSSLDNLKLPADVKKDVKKMLQFSKQKQTRRLPSTNIGLGGESGFSAPSRRAPASKFANSPVPDVSSPVPAYRPSPYAPAPGSPVPMRQHAPFGSRKSELFRIDGYIITFIQEGSKPLQITLKKAENKLKTNTWSFKVKEIDKLPADIQKTVEKALEEYRKRIHIRDLNITPKKIEELRKLLVAKGVKLPASYHTLLKSQPNQQLTEMNKQIKALTAAIEKLNKKLDEK